MDETATLSATSRRWSVSAAYDAMQAGSLLYIDIRDGVECADGFPVGAAHVPLYRFDTVGTAHLNAQFVDEIRTLLRGHGCDGAVRRAAVGCAHGVRSRQAVMLLALAGIVVDDVPGGWDGRRDELGRVIEPGWRQVGLPIATKPAA
mgnify:FL=1|jgi:rhodanese-related sulfurtransferase